MVEVSIGFIRSMLNQTATYWAPGGYSVEGAITFSSPVSIPCRWESKREIFIDNLGKEKRSQALVFVDRELQETGYLYLGSSTATDPLSLSGTYEIKATKAVPSISAAETEYSVFL